MSTRAYVTDERFDLLTAAIAEGESEIAFFHKRGTNGDGIAEAKQQLEIAAKQGKWLVAHNIAFDGLVLALAWGIRFAHYFDTAAYLRYLGLGESLANGARLFGWRKMAAPPFCEQTLLDSALLDKIASYNAKDTLIARRLFQAALDDDSFPDLEFWAVDQVCRANLQGIAIDRNKAEELAALCAQLRDSRQTELCRQFQTFDIDAITNPHKVKAFLKEAFNVELASIDKRSPEFANLKASGGKVTEFLEQRDSLLSWTKATQKMRRIAIGAGRVFNPRRYHGAHTGRYSASGRDADRINIQNLEKAGKGERQALAGFRTVLVPEQGQSWVSCDLSTIEPRVTAFLAGQTNLLERFAAGDDVYIWFAGMAFPNTRIIKGGENNHLRNLCKAAVIGLGYGMGRDRFHQTLLREDSMVSEKMSHELHQHYQVAFPRVIGLRKRLWRAFCGAAYSGTATQEGGCVITRTDGGKGTGKTVCVKLPTGRTLFYRSIKIRREQAPWGKLIRAYYYADRFYFDPRQASRRSAGGARRIKFSDGQMRARIIPQTLIENVVQAVARDVLVGQMQAIERRGLPVAFSVHDELVVATDRCHCPRRDESRNRGEEVDLLHEADCPWIHGRKVVAAEMSRVAACFPKLAGLPIAGELSDTIRDCYGK